LTALRIPPQFAHAGPAAEYLLAALGVMVVMVVGHVWRLRSLQAVALEESKRQAKMAADG
jgi:hypothetical protein